MLISNICDLPQVDILRRPAFSDPFLSRTVLLLPLSLDMGTVYDKKHVTVLRSNISHFSLINVRIR